MKKYLLISFLLLLPLVIFAATNDFTASSDITVSAVTFDSTTANMLILSGSTAESWNFNGGTFTVTNPGTFQVGSSESAVKAIEVSQSGSTLVCAENSTPGTSYATVPTTAGTYTVSPSARTACTSLCTTVSNAATYNSFPTCGAATCNSGYWLSGSGSSATCVLIGGGGVIGGGGGGSVPTPVYTVIPGTGATATTAAPAISSTPSAPSVATPSAVAQIVSPVFNTTLKYGVTSNDVKRLQQLLATDKSIYPEGIVSGWFGQLTRKAIQKFQCKHNIVCSGTPTTTGYGVFGPKTRAKTAEVFGK